MKILPILFLLLFSNPLIAQDVLLFEDTKAETLVFSASNTHASTALRQMLQPFETLYGHSASFDLYYEYECRLIEKPDHLFGDLHFTVLDISRSPVFRGFSFADLLRPSSVALTIDLLANDELVYAVSQNIPLSQLNQAFIDFNYADIQPSTSYSMVVREMQFKYSNTAVQTVSWRKEAIDQYYLAAGDLRQIRSNILSLEAAQVDPDHINTIKNEIDQWGIQFEKIDNAAFWSVLPLQINDPEEIFILHSQVGQELDNTQAWIKDLIANIHVLFYEKGLDFFENRQLSAAKSSFEKSIRAAKYYAPSHYFLAYIDFGDGHIEQAGRRIIKVLNDYEPDAQTRQYADELARNIMISYFEAGQRAVDAGAYPEGIDIYHQAQAFGQRIRGFDFGQEEAENRIYEAYYLDFHHQVNEVVLLQRQGHFQQALINLEQALVFQLDFNINSTVDTYSLHGEIVLAVFGNKLSDIERLAQNQAWDEAITGIEDAESFLSFYQEFIRDQRQWLAIKKKVYTGKHQNLFQLAASSKANGQLDKALGEAVDAVNFATNNDLSSSLVDDSRQQVSQIQKSRYQRFITGGDKARQQQQYDAALQQYDAARALENKLLYLPASVALEQKLKGTALQEIKQQYNAVMRQNKYNNARLAKTFAHIQGISGRYYLTLDPDVKAIYRQLEEQLCANANDLLLPELEEKLAHYQQRADYGEARNIMEDIKSLLSAYPDCALDDKIVMDQAASIAACATYQKTLETARSAEKSRRFRTSLDYYLRAKKLYENPMVSSRLEGHPAFDTYEYILGHPEGEMVMAGANLYLDQRNHEASLALLKSLINGGLPPKRTEVLQKRLGRALAVREHMPSANWKLSFGAFIEKEERKKYRNLRKAFRRQWNRMG